MTQPVPWERAVIDEIRLINQIYDKSNGGESDSHRQAALDARVVTVANLIRHVSTAATSELREMRTLWVHMLKDTGQPNGYGIKDFLDEKYASNLKEHREQDSARIERGYAAEMGLED